MAPFALGHINAPRAFYDMPQELIDRTIDLLRGDTAALRACSLAYRAMRSRAQFHIYHTAHLTPNRWTEYDALATQSPHLGGNVRRLCVTQPVAVLTRSGRQTPHIYGYERFVRPQTTRTPPLFPAVTTLELKTLDHTALSPLLLGNACDLRTIETIHLRSCVFFTMDHVAGFICNFPRLKSLSICDVFSVDEYKQPSASRVMSCVITGPVKTIVRPAIEELRFCSDAFTLGVDSSIGLTKWLFDQGMHGRLSTLEITVTRRVDVAALNVCLYQLGPHLQRLYLTIEQLDNDGESTPSPSVKQDPNSCLSYSVTQR